MKSTFRLFFSVGLVGLLTACGGGDSTGMGETTALTELNTTNTQTENTTSTPGPFSAGDFGDINLSGDYTSLQASWAGATLIDIRTAWERDKYGYPEGFTTNIPYQNRDYQANGRYNVKPLNPTFVVDVTRAVKDDLHKKIILICDSSSRTGAHNDKTKDSAAKLLSEKGFTNVYHIFGGYRGNMAGSYANGWIDYNLPLGK